MTGPLTLKNRLSRVNILLAVFICLLKLTLFVSVAAAQSDEDTAKTKIKEFKSAYDSARDNTRIRIQTFNHLNDLDHPKVIKLLAGTVIPNEIKKDDPLVVNRIIQTLRQAKSDETIEELIKAVQKKPLARQLILIRAMGKIEHTEVNQQLIGFLSEKKPALRIAAINALADSRPAEAIPLVLDALTAKKWPVRASAINYLTKVTDESKSSEIIQALRAQQSQETGRLKNDISRAIKNFSWSKKPDDQSDEETVALFYGIPIYSKNLIFVADTSGSMTAPDESGTPRIRILRKELAGVVKGLADDVKFNIIVFNDDATQWQTKQVPVKQYKKAALAWIEKNVETIRPGQFKGHTNLYSGLTLALNITQTSKKEVKLVPTGQVSSKAGVDTIVIISDGRPDRGTYISMDEIRSVARTLNQTLQIKINTIAISIPENIAESDFLRKLAEENNGTYINKK